MRIRVLWVGKTRERWLAEGIEKYLKLARTLAEVEVIEVREDKGDDRAASAKREGARILDALGGRPFVLMDERGRELESVGLAAMVRDRSRVDFVIGGPYGVSDDVRAAAAETLALSRMTLTHEMARLLLMEQAYRALSINAGRGYHH